MINVNNEVFHILGCNSCIHEDLCKYSEKFLSIYSKIKETTENDLYEDKKFRISIKCKSFKEKTN